MNFLHALLLILPKKIVSYLVGALVRLELPPGMQSGLNDWFVKAFKLDMSEASEPMSSYKSLEDIFTRRLKEGARTIASSPYVSPADGVLSFSQAVRDGEAIQAKGLSYRPTELVFGQETPQSEPHFAWYATVYLAPHNYHRVHTPVAGRLTGITYFPGKLWPVNETFVNLVPALFVANERLVFHIAVEGGGMVHVVMVGALNVGRMQVTCKPDFFTNQPADFFASMGRDVPMENPLDLRAGDELGVFMLGSTVVTVFDEEAYRHLQPAAIQAKQSVRMGQNLSAVLTKE